MHYKAHKQNASGFVPVIRKYREKNDTKRKL